MNFLIIFCALLGICSSQKVSLSLTSCKSVGLIKDKDGRIVKGVCELSIAYTYNDAVAACAINGMELFFAEDQYVYNSFIDYSNQLLGTVACIRSPSCGFYVNGKKNLNDGKWYATINGQQQAMDLSFYNWVQNSTANSAGNCMSVKNQYGFKNTPWNCELSYFPVCEFNNTYQYPAPPTPTLRPGCEVSNQGKRYYNLAPCKSIGTLRDNCGNIAKGVCELNAVYPYADAIQACRNVGMDLFVAENQAIYNSFIQYIQGQFGKHTCGAIWNNGCGLWIGGMKSSGAYNSVKDWKSVALDTSFYSLTPSTTPGDCIAVKNNNGFKFVNYACTQAYGNLIR